MKINLTEDEIIEIIYALMKLNQAQGNDYKRGKLIEKLKHGE